MSTEREHSSRGRRRRNRHSSRSLASRIKKWNYAKVLFWIAWALAGTFVLIRIVLSITALDWITLG